MSRARRSAFSAVKTEGGLLPDDLLEQVAAFDSNLKGLSNPDYHLADHERIGDEVNRSWTKLLGYWHAYKQAVAEAPEGDTTNKLTRERWLLPLFKELGYGQLPSGMSIEVDDKKLAVSHGWANSPIHLMGCRVPLDKKQKGVRGAAKTAPHGLVQAFLNRSDDHLWGFVSNGYTLRILRDHHSLTRQAYVEFDLQSIMDGELYSEFMLLWLVCHQSRVEGKKPEDCWLEKWFQQARDEGVRVLDDLRAGVEAAIKSFGTGFLKHRDNGALREGLRTGELKGEWFYRELLRLVYRLIFIFVSEDRGALLDRTADETTRRRYGRFYSTRRLRRLAGLRRGSPHHDLWSALQLVMKGLSTGLPELGLPALGSFLWSDEATPWLDQGECDNEHLLGGVRDLCWHSQGKVRYPVNWKSIGAEELGSVYESLLELHPKFDSPGGGFDLQRFGKGDRKKTGSYYTPTALVECLLDSALDPALRWARSEPDPERAILDLKVCDPACGSGHFLVAAARRIAKHLARFRSGDDEPSPEAQQVAIRDVVGRCLYGVDINPMAVELCKISLWLEAVEGGPPLSFLESHILCGNSLLGTTPALMGKGIPDCAFQLLDGDQKAILTRIAKQNAEERSAQSQIPFPATTDIAQTSSSLNQLSDQSLEGIEAKRSAWRKLQESEPYTRARQLADAWCSAFLWPKRSERDVETALTHDRFLQYQENPSEVPGQVRKTVARISAGARFAHWHLLFPHVFSVETDGQTEGSSEPTGWHGGFDVVLGNPPWKMPEVDDRVFFASRDQSIAQESSAKKRRTRIAALEQDAPDLFEEWQAYARRFKGERVFFSKSGRYPTAGRGRLNYYKVFLEQCMGLLGSKGRLGLLIESGLATNVYERPLWHKILDSKQLVLLYDFENRKPYFPDIDSRKKFSAIVVSREPQDRFQVSCWLHDVSELADPGRVVEISSQDLSRWSPGSRTLPQFRNTTDLRLLEEATEALSPLGSDPTWKHEAKLMFSSSDAAFAPVPPEAVAGLRPTQANRIATADAALVPVYEGKMVGVWDHRQADIYVNPSNPSRQAQEKAIPDGEKASPNRLAIPQHWLPLKTVRDRRFGKSQGEWELVFCDVTSATNERTSIPAIVPLSGLTRSLPALYLDPPDAERACLLCLLLGSLPFDSLTRLKVAGNHLTQDILSGMPVPPASAFAQFETRIGVEGSHWFRDRGLELLYTAWDLEPFASDCGYSAPPFKWNPERRYQIRSEIDAACFHLLSIERADADYMLDGFPIIRKRDVKLHGEFRTKLQTLRVYDEMEAAMRTKTPFRTQLDPPPGHPSLAHPPLEASKRDLQRCYRCGSANEVLELETAGRRAFYCESCKPKGSAR